MPLGQNENLSCSRLKENELLTEKKTTNQRNFWKSFTLLLVGSIVTLIVWVTISYRNHPLVIRMNWVGEQMEALTKWREEKKVKSKSLREKQKTDLSKWGRRRPKE